jgi:hypothetical protein
VQITKVVNSQTATIITTTTTTTISTKRYLLPAISSAKEVEAVATVGVANNNKSFAQTKKAPLSPIFRVHPPLKLHSYNENLRYCCIHYIININHHKYS